MEETNVDDLTKVSRLAEILTSEYRRKTIRYLEDSPTPVAVSSLTEHLEQDMNQSDRSRQSDDLEERVLSKLKHSHLPRMDEYDVVEYDQTSDEVEPGPSFPKALSLLKSRY